MQQRQSAGIMNKAKSKDSSEADTMRAEYDFDKMRVYRRGPGRRRQSDTDVLHVTIDDDVSRVFPDAAAINEALRLLIRQKRRGVGGHEALNQRSRS